MPQPEPAECFISVDVETAGPVPSLYSLLSIGACLVDRPEVSFYVELAPEHEAALPAALEVSKLSMEELAQDGTHPEVAMRQFAEWVDEVTPKGERPVFVGFNAAFDWMFVADYFERHLGRNPFGHAAVDIKAYYMGKAGSTLAQSSMSELSPRYLGGSALSHNALGDARDQAALFRAILADSGAAHDA
ncbi:3'-5' exonuclease [Antiquaquibacter oligotrophicus]|nr:3'-5' exonuclease [Antiquaquibacter oligotrophicus]UDF13683.1 3'-5' exonuclease [Antiquaquibacter oligotrophicus]